MSEPVSQEAPALDEVEADSSTDADDSAVVAADDSAVVDAEDTGVVDAEHSAEEAPVVEEYAPEYGYEPVVDEHVAEEHAADEHVAEDHDFEAHDAPAVEPVDDPAPYAEAHAQNGVVPASEVGAVDGDAPAEVSDEPATDGREAMRALLAELSPEFEEAVAAPVSEPVDGLMDRGPWTSSELEQMGGWQREDGKDVIAWPDDEKASDPVTA